MTTLKATKTVFLRVGMRSELIKRRRSDV